MSNQQFIQQVGQFAQDDFERSGIFPSIKIAQAILESAWGQSELAQNANNLFGIKGTWNGQSYKIRTREEDANGNSFYVNADFRKYPTVKESIEDHSDFFTSTPWRTKNYKSVRNANSYQVQARALQSSGYATDKEYANKLINLIQSNNLDSWDNGGNSVSMTIAVSRGHGGYGVTPGKRSPAGEYEWHFNDKVADAFEKEMKKYNVKIIQVSDASGRVDTPLAARTNTANRNNALLYVAFHHNANTGRWGNWTGSEVWVRPNAPQAAKLARNVAPRVSKAMNIRNRGVKAGNLHEVREPNQHAILIEGGFMDSTIDITAMRRDDMLAAQGRAVAAGVASYYGLKKKSSNSVAKKPSKPAPKKSAPKKSSGSKSISKMADEVIAGQHGSGHANRQRSLSVDNATYQKVRAEVNRRAGVTSAPKKSAPKKQSKSIAQMATEVINGQHGAGHANRRRSLGVNQATYDKVRALVNHRAGSGSSEPRGKSISQMATEVLQGLHGNGHANRQRSLGADNATYQKVRAEVNRRS